jgi:hypothetical protein
MSLSAATVHKAANTRELREAEHGCILDSLEMWPSAFDEITTMCAVVYKEKPRGRKYPTRLKQLRVCSWKV